ncbi:MAG: glycosyltransferase family 4 protein [Candidatus Omnitrophica bacterium]|nr:glycosyltransferase family 4 protein [Candidatus Omnitrophota bacterium]
MYKILYVNGSCNIGGAEVSLLNLVKRLDKNYLSIVALPCEGELSDRLKKSEIAVKIISLGEFSKKRAFPFLFSTLKLADFIKKERINLIHANSIYISEQSYFAARLAKVPCICHVRDLIPVLGAGKLRLSAFKNAKKLVAISEAVKKDLVEKLHIPDDKIVRIYNGVDTEEFSPDTGGMELRSEFNLGQEKLIGMIGRFSPEKGQEIFIRTAAEILKNYSDVKFIIAGDAKLGSEKFKAEIIELAARLGINTKVIFAGFRNDLPKVLAALDLLVVPSFAEPFGRVIIEAMAMEKPVIAFNSGAAKEIITGECGELVELNSTQQLKNSVIRILQNKELASNMGRKGRAIVLDRFSIGRHVKEIEGLYKEILR